MKFQHFLLAALSVMLFTFSTCKKENNTCEMECCSAMSLKFNPVAEGGVFDLYLPYTYMTGSPYKISTLQFFLTDFRLLKGTEEISLGDQAAFISYADAATDLTVASLTNVPEGDYTGIRFGIGVAPDLNAKEPENFDNNNPLSRRSEYWDAWGGYIFSKVEGNVDVPGDPQPFYRGFIYHSGTNGQYVEKTITYNFSIDACNNPQIPLTLDVERLFYNAVDTVDLLNNSFVHAGSPSDPTYTITLFIANNFPAAISVE